MTAPREVVVDDDGLSVEFRAVRWALITSKVCVALLVGGAVALLLSQPWPDLVWEPLIPLSLAGWLYAAVVVPRIAIGPDQLLVVGLLRQRTFALRDVRSASSGYYGLSLLFDGDRYASSNVGQTPNYQRWMGRVSRGDRIAGLIEHRAAKARGENPGPLVLAGRRRAGNWTAAIMVLVASIFRAGS